jgi:hypothetical protein
MWTPNGWMGPWDPLPYPTLADSSIKPRAMHLTSPRTERQVTAASVEQQEIKLGSIESSTNKDPSSRMKSMWKAPKAKRP